MKTQIFWHGKGKYEYWPAGAYDEIEYPAEVRAAPYYRTSARYCEKLGDLVKIFRLYDWEVWS